MKVREITPEPTFIDKITDALGFSGDKTKGSNAKKDEPTPASTILQYPAQRSAGRSGPNDYLYQNGLLFMAYDLSKRSSSNIKSFRNSKKSQIVGKLDAGVLKSTKATILMPRSISEVDAVSHKLGDVKDSVIGKASRGGGGAGSAISNIMSDALWKMIDNTVGGAVFADNAEQMYTATRATYQGAEKRTKVFSWNLVPKNVDDLKQIHAIYKMFLSYSYGSVGNSAYVEETTRAFHKAYVGLLAGDEAANKSSMDDTLVGNALSFLSNVNVVSNPTVWMVKNFYANDNESKIDLDDFFGPAQIQSIRFDKTPDGHFNGLANFPNISGSYILEVTMQEIVALDNSSFSKHGGGL